MSTEEPPFSRDRIAEVLGVMQGQISAPQDITSFKNQDGPTVTRAALVQEGSGLIGLEDSEDNKEWAGLFNHILLTARVATFLGNKLQKAGEAVDISLLKAAILSSHSGRRIWDERNWYREAVPNYDTKLGKNDTELTIELLQNAQLPDVLIETVEAHGVGNQYPYEKMDTWEKKLALYADFRVAQSVLTLSDRFDDLQARAVASGRFTQDWLDTTRSWASEVEQEIFAKIPDLTPETITNEYPPMPVWEGYLRRLYIQDAEAGIFKKMTQLQTELEQASTEEELLTARIHMEAEFPPTTWWGRCARELYNRQFRQP